MKDRILKAIDAAIEGKKYLLYKWQGEYGMGYPPTTREFQQKAIKAEIEEFGELKNEIKSAEILR